MYARGGFVGLRVPADALVAVELGARVRISTALPAGSNVDLERQQMPCGTLPIQSLASTIMGLGISSRCYLCAVVAQIILPTKRSKGRSHPSFGQLP